MMTLIIAVLIAVGRIGGWADGPSAHSAAHRPISPSAHPTLVYVANQASGKVTVIDAATDSVVAVVDFTTLGFSAHPKPHHIVVEPGGDTSQVIVGLAVSPDGKTLVATAQLTGKLLVFDLADPAKPKLVQRVATGDWPWL